MILYGILTIVACFFLMKLLAREMAKPDISPLMRQFHTYLGMALFVGLIIGLVLIFGNVQGTRLGSP